MSSQTLGCLISVFSFLCTTIPYSNSEGETMVFHILEAWAH